MPDEKHDTAFWTGIVALLLLAAVLALCTQALIVQSWRLGIGALGGGAVALCVLSAVAGIVSRARRSAGQPEGFEPCQKPVYKGYGAPEPCADEAGHDGHCTP